MTRTRRSSASETRYTHDAWNRLVKVQVGGIPLTTKGEYEYNGLHWRTVKKVPSGANTAERRMYYSASWQLLEERIDSNNSTFAEEKCAQTVWGLRYIDEAVLRRQDANQDYDYSDSGERTDYCITDPQFSVVAVVSDTGDLQESIAYSAYGEARHHYPADADGDGDVDGSDMLIFTSIGNLKSIDQAGYKAQLDLDRDGDVNSTDAAIANTNWNGKAALGAGLISAATGPDSPIGYDGYVFNAETKIYTVRFRHYEPAIGRWMERDPSGFKEQTNLYLYALSAPIVFNDWAGLISRIADPPDDSESIVDLEGYLNAVAFFSGGDYHPYWTAASEESLICDISEAGEYSQCVLECIADDPTKFLDALKAAGFAVGKDALEDINFLLALPFMFVQIDPSSGLPEPDTDKGLGEFLDSWYGYLESRAVADGNKACAMHDAAMDAIELWTRNGGYTPEDQAMLLKQIKEARELGQRAFRKGFRRSGLRAIGTSAAKVSGAATVAYEVGVALKAAMEQAGEDCKQQCGTCPWAASSDE